MVADVIISARGLGKKYVIGHKSTERVPTLRDAIVRGTTGFLRSGKDLFQGKPLISGDTREEFWALKDVDFDIHRGDVVGIIGRNGAGKSTLLKVLSRITEPSKGRVEIDGRVASLLEVGTGFHPELTGRENIFLNGAVLGMTQAEIRKKFDEIVAFAEVEKFLDTPVKRYSSGMYVRLAFAVAAHLEPEILIVDEVLAVGDAEFQKKCLGKMQDVAGHGRTVLFVSHNMSAVRALCPSSIFLRGGNIAFSGPTDGTIARYLEDTKLAPSVAERSIDGAAFTAAILSQSVLSATTSDGMTLLLHFSASQPVTFSEFALIVSSMDSHRVGVIDFRTLGSPISVSGPVEVAVRVSTPSLVRGLYQLKLWVAAGTASMDIDLGTIEVVEATSNEAIKPLTNYKSEVNGAALFFGTIDFAKPSMQPRTNR